MCIYNTGNAAACVQNCILYIQLLRGLHAFMCVCVCLLLEKDCADSGGVLVCILCT